MTTHLNKAQRLAIAGAIAPVLRSQSESTSQRLVKVYDQTRDPAATEALYEAPAAEVQKGILRSIGVEFDVDVESDKARSRCPGWGEEGCSKRAPLSAMKACRVSARGASPWRCSRHVQLARMGSDWRPQPSCAGGCGSSTPNHENRPSAVARRGGEGWRCYPCHVRQRYGPEAMSHQQKNCAGGMDHKPCPLVPSADMMRPSRVQARNGQPWRCQKHAHEANGRRRARFCPGIDGALCGERLRPWQTICSGHKALNPERQKTCVGWEGVPCDAIPGKHSFSAESIRDRGGDPWMCCKHAVWRARTRLAPDHDNRRIEKVRAFWTPERREEARVREQARRAKAEASK